MRVLVTIVVRNTTSAETKNKNEECRNTERTVRNGRGGDDVKPEGGEVQEMEEAKDGGEGVLGELKTYKRRDILIQLDVLGLSFVIILFV